MSSPFIPDRACLASQNHPLAEAALVCRARSWFCAFQVADVVETMRPLPVQSLAVAVPFVRGAAVIRGVQVPVVDVGSLFSAGDETKDVAGRAATPAASPARFVVVRAGRSQVALAVEEVLGVHRFPASTLRYLPPLLRETNGDAAAAVGRLDAELLVVFRAARLLPEWPREPLTPPTGEATL